jgi:transcription-repair coupling factor (superfamily II helicase)
MPPRIASSPGAPAPVRIELDGDVVDALRRFDAASQRSTGPVEKVSIPLVAPQDYLRARRASSASLLEHLPEGGAVVVIEPARCRERLGQTAARFVDRARDLLAPDDLEATLARLPVVLVGEGAIEDPLARDALRVQLPFEPALVGSERAAVKDPSAVMNDLARLVNKGERLTVACLTDAEQEHLAALLKQAGLEPRRDRGLRTAKDGPGVSLVTWPLDAGFRHRPSGAWLVASHRLFSRHRRGEAGARRRTKAGAHQAVETIGDLEEGQHVVHVSHGIALFKGIVQRERDGQVRELLELEFDGGTLFIPTDRIGLVRRWVGPSASPPRLSKLGGTGWKAKTSRAAEAVKDLAAELLEVQAERQVRVADAFPVDEREQTLFEESFGYTDTEDQARVTAEVEADLARPHAMDRLVCGDVGYGKTEIAVRAAFQCVQAGFQCAVLVPTTVLAHQHHRTFSERMAAYPFRIDVLSRFRTQQEQRLTLTGLEEGQVDIVIGTHRLLSKDVVAKRLGLVIIDEEQRFGVEHKEKLKALKRTVHVLTLSATPIPRTLHLALSGARDISVLHTPPPGRAPVETKVARFSRGLIKRAVERELARDGQVFVVHDRVKSIDVLAELIVDCVPTARVLVVHGQLAEHELEERMLKFVEHEADVLVATTLIENGLDIKRANTLLVDRAHHYGLAELHQLRGRVGRSDLRAYAYFLLPEHGGLSDVAARRLRAIEEFTDLGAGFHIAMRDLEIRGAGNVLGAEPSGHLANVGHDPSTAAC